jgi:hypothetical protein
MKSILGYGLIGLLATALLGGSAFILLNPTDTHAERGGGNGQAASASVENGAARHGNGTETSGQYAYGRSEANEERRGPGGEISGNNGAGNGSGNGNGNGNGQGGGSGQGQSEAGTIAEWGTLSGTVVTIDGELVIETAEGQVTVGLGQSTYRDEMGFTLEVGDEVVVTGFYEDGEFKAGTIENITTGQTIILRGETGRPMWAGRGQLKNQGQGQGQGQGQP